MFKIYILCSKLFPINLAICEIMWRNMVDPDRPQMRIQHGSFDVCWMTTAINTHTEYVKIIVCPLQQWLGERASMLHCTYIACLVPFVCVCVCVWRGGFRKDGYSDSRLPQTNREELCATLLKNSISSLRVGYYC